MRLRPLIVLISMACLPLVTNQASASYFDGMEAYRQNDYQTAMREFKAAPDDAKALYMIGVMNEKGEGVPVNYEEAASLYKQAIDKSSPIAQYRLGRLYERGLGVEQNLDEAIKLYKRAAKAGQLDAKQALKRLEAK